MSLKVYNTLHRKKELFEPIEKGKVRMYVCGPTVYNYISIGNSRPIVVFNMVRNYLQFSGYKVEYIQNITDVEDKIIKKADEEKVDYKVITTRYIKAFLEDVKNLEVGGFNKMPLATEMIAEIIDIIKKIIENGYGYVVDCNVYFEVSKFLAYGKLSGQNISEMKDTGDNSFEKRNKIDFALWKKAKEGEPFWDSPWGRGRPGWHIECSAMSTTLLDRNIDIHGGGIDLIFPHHENEIAQSEAAFPREGDFVRYWMHNGMIEVKSGKMSKSLGLKNNWILKNLLKSYSPDTIKMYILSTHYRSPLEFSMEKLEEAGRALEKITNTLKNIKFLIEQKEGLSGGGTGGKADMQVISRLGTFTGKFEVNFKNSMDDDFNSARAIGDIFEFIKNINNIIQKPDFKNNASLKKSLSGAYIKIKELGLVLGLNFIKEVSKISENIETRIEITKEEIEKLITERETARKNKDYKKADEIRNYLYSMGIILEDRKEGTLWKSINKRD
ncbi:MAG: cysteine--tRNA ligase [Actinobacteria bacterium]|nr:cysteine--tRNA ligase [Actinomycetota bacterium]